MGILILIWFHRNETNNQFFSVKFQYHVTKRILPVKMKEWSFSKIPLVTLVDFDEKVPTILEYHSDSEIGNANLK